MRRIKTSHVGIYYRESAKRPFYNGQPDICFDILYRVKEKIIWEKVGWASEGYSIQDAIEIRKKRVRTLRHSEQSPLDEPVVSRRPAKGSTKNCRTSNDILGKRIKTVHVGVYYRESERRPTYKGKPDRCFDISYRVGKKIIWEKIGWKSEGYSVQDALDIRSARIRASRHPELDGGVSPSPQTRLDEAWEAFCTWLPNLKRAASFRSVYSRHIQPALGKHALTDITAQQVEKFKQELLKKELQRGTVKQILAILRRILTKAKEWKLPGSEQLPAKCFGVSRADHKRERFLTAAEAEKLLDGLQFIDCRYYHIAKIALYTGMRLSEVLNLKKDQIDTKLRVISIDGKTGPRPVYVPNELVRDMERLCEAAKSFLFVTTTGTVLRTKKISTVFSHILRDMGFNEGVTDSSQAVVFHTLRHTFCSWLAIKGVPLLTIAKLAGHRTIEMTQRYAKLSPDCQLEALDNIEKTLKEK